MKKERRYLNMIVHAGDGFPEKFEENPFAYGKPDAEKKATEVVNRVFKEFPELLVEYNDSEFKAPRASIRKFLMITDQITDQNLPEQNN